MVPAANAPTVPAPAQTAGGTRDGIDEITRSDITGNLGKAPNYIGAHLRPHKHRGTLPTAAYPRSQIPVREEAGSD